MKLDLGAGGRPREGFRGVDLVKLGDGIAFDLVAGDKWPFEDNSVEELSSSHFIEHIPLANVFRYRQGSAPHYVKAVWQDALFFFFDEAFRIIQPGGLFHLTWPALKSADAFRDPTHRRFIPIEMLHYLSAEGRRSMGLEHYEAVCNWVVVDGSARYDLAVPRPEFEQDDAVKTHEHFWDVTKAISVTLRAEK